MPPRQVEVYEQKMKSLGKSVEVDWFETGHINSRLQVDQAIRHQELMLRFAYRILGA